MKYVILEDSEDETINSCVDSTGSELEVIRSTSLNAYQYGDEHIKTPLLPPDMSNRSDVSSFDKNSTMKQRRRMARDLQNNDEKSKNRRRKFVWGLLYHQLDQKCFIIDLDNNGKIDINVELHNGFHTLVMIRDAIKETSLLNKIQQLGTDLSKKHQGNCRLRSGDKGNMWSLGIRDIKKQLPYKISRDNANIRHKTALICKGAKKCMSTLFQDSLEDIMTTFDPTIKRDYTGGENGFVHRLIMSEDLGNASHIDLDETMSVSVWVEKEPGQAKNWYFVMPNLQIDGSLGVAIKLRHGLAVSWDGRKIRHCSSIPEPGEDNHVYGCFFSGTS